MRISKNLSWGPVELSEAQARTVALCRSAQTVTIRATRVPEYVNIKASGWVGTLDPEGLPVSPPTFKELKAAGVTRTEAEYLRTGAAERWTAWTALLQAAL